MMRALCILSVTQFLETSILVITDTEGFDKADTFDTFKQGYPWKTACGVKSIYTKTDLYASCN